MKSSRRDFLKGAGIGVLAVSLPSNVFPSGSPDHVSRLVADAFSWRGSFSAPEDAISHSRDRYSFHVPYQDDDRDAVEDWVDASDDRSIRRWNDPISTVTVVMPPGHIDDATDTGWFDSSRLIDLNIRMETAEIESLPSDEADDWQPTNTLERLLMRARHNASEPASDGIAFDDVDRATPEESRDVCGAGSDTIWADADTSGLTAAIIDTGFNVAGGDVLGDEDRVLDTSKSFVEDETVEGEGFAAIEDGNGHGTHVASDMCANPEAEDYQGYMRDSDVLILRALDDDGGGETADIAASVSYAADEGADVLCMSLGSPFWSEELERAISYARDEGVVVVVAAGNDGNTPNPFLNSPADSENVIAVAASETADPEDARTAAFSSRSPDPGTLNMSDGETVGASVDITAPGMESECLVADTRGRTDEVAKSGTSMACPKIAGAVGVLLAETDADDSGIKDRLTTHAAPVPAQGVNEAGAGMLDLDAAYDEDEPDDAQEGARDDEAQARDEGWDALSNLYGRRVTRLLLSV